MKTLIHLWQILTRNYYFQLPILLEIGNKLSLKIPSLPFLFLFHPSLTDHSFLTLPFCSIKFSYFTRAFVFLYFVHILFCKEQQNLCFHVFIDFFIFLIKNHLAVQRPMCSPQITISIYDLIMMHHVVLYKNEGVKHTFV